MARLAGLVAGLLAGACVAVRAAEVPAPPPAEAEPLLVTRPGDVPIVLSAPHGGRRPIPGVPDRRGDGAAKFVTVRDENTAELAQRLAVLLQQRLGRRPYLVVAHFARKSADANRPAADAHESPAAREWYDGYHRALREACGEVRRRWGRGLLVDLHGQSADGEAIFRGTVDGRTTRGLRERFGAEALVGPRGLCGALEARGYRLVPSGAGDQREDPRFLGGFIVRTYGGGDLPGIDAVQLELGNRLRARERLERTAADLAAALAVFAAEFLPAADCCGPSGE